MIGGGFAGLEVAERLSGEQVDVLLLDRNPYTTFQPLLYQVATGGLNPGDVTHSLRALCAQHPNVRFRQADVTGLDLDGRTVDTSGGPISYDWLVVACGAVANHFGVDGAAEHSLTIYTRGDSLEVRDRVFGRLEIEAQRPTAEHPTIVVVGGGPTGVELAGMFAEMRDALPSAYPEIDPARLRVVLVEMSEAVLGAFSSKVSDYTAHELTDRGVELRLGSAVASVAGDHVVLDSGERIDSVATIWASGVKGHEMLADWGLPTGRAGRVEVGADLRVIGRGEVFAAGDAAVNPDDPLPQLAQPAIQGGRHVADEILRSLRGDVTEGFHYVDKGTMATIGRADAVIEFPNGRTITGFVAWIGWVALHIVTLVGHRNRLSTLANLSVRYLSRRKRLDVIVGHTPAPE